MYGKSSAFKLIFLVKILQIASFRNFAFDVAQWRSVAKIKFCRRKMRDKKKPEKWDSPPLRLRPGIHSHPPPHQHDHDHQHLIDHHQDHHRHDGISLAHHNGDCGRPVPEKFTLREDAWGEFRIKWDLNLLHWKNVRELDILILKRDKKWLPEKKIKNGTIWAP